MLAHYNDFACGFFQKCFLLAVIHSMYLVWKMDVTLWFWISVIPLPVPTPTTLNRVSLCIWMSVWWCGKMCVRMSVRKCFVICSSNVRLMVHTYEKFQDLIDIVLVWWYIRRSKYRLISRIWVGIPSKFCHVSLNGKYLLSEFQSFLIVVVVVVTSKVVACFIHWKIWSLYFPNEIDLMTRITCFHINVILKYEISLFIFFCSIVQYSWLSVSSFYLRRGNGFNQVSI